MNFIELFVIFAVALIVLGPEKLPEVARTLGKLSGQARRAADQLRREFYNNLYPPTKPTEPNILQAARDLRTLKDEIKSEIAHVAEETKEPKP